MFCSSAPPLSRTSPDGVNWTTRAWTVPQNQPETQLNDIAIGNGKLTAVGANGTIISSTDSGVTWSIESQINNNTTFISEFSGVTANASLRVAVGRNSAFKKLINISIRTCRDVPMGRLFLCSNVTHFKTPVWKKI